MTTRRDGGGVGLDRARVAVAVMMMMLVMREPMTMRASRLGRRRGGGGGGGGGGTFLFASNAKTQEGVGWGRDGASMHDAMVDGIYIPR